MRSPLARALTIGSLCLSGLMLAAAHSGRSAPPTPATVAIVDLGKLTANLDEANTLEARVKTQGEEYQKELQKVKDELTAVTKELEQMGNEKKGTAEYLRLFARQYELEVTTKARLEGLQKLIDVAKGDNMKQLFTKVTKTVERLGKERGYDLILWDDRAIGVPTKVATAAEVWSVVRDRRVLYASDRIDITNDVLTMMNNEFKAGKK